MPIGTVLNQPTAYLNLMILVRSKMLLPPRRRLSRLPLLLKPQQPNLHLYLIGLRRWKQSKTKRQKKPLLLGPVLRRLPNTKSVKRLYRLLKLSMRLKKRLLSLQQFHGQKMISGRLPKLKNRWNLQWFHLRKSSLLPKLRKSDRRCLQRTSKLQLKQRSKMRWNLSLPSLLR